MSKEMNTSMPLRVCHEEQGSPPFPGTPGTTLGTVVPVWWLFGLGFEDLVLQISFRSNDY